jgi:hypothetical protein
VEEYPSLKEFFEALKIKLNLITIFIAAKDKLRELVAGGKVTLPKASLRSSVPPAAGLAKARREGLE